MSKINDVGYVDDDGTSVPTLPTATTTLTPINDIYDINDIAVTDGISGRRIDDGIRDIHDTFECRI